MIYVHACVCMHVFVSFTRASSLWANLVEQLEMPLIDMHHTNNKPPLKRGKVGTHFLIREPTVMMPVTDTNTCIHTHACT